MKLTVEELHNLRICCRRVAKLEEVNETEMAYLLNLSAKIAGIIDAESPKTEEPVKELKEEVETLLEEK